MNNFASFTQYLSTTRLVLLLQQMCHFLFFIKLTLKQTTYLLYAQLSAVAMLFPLEMSLGWRLFFFVAFTAALKRSGILRKIGND